MIERSAGFSRWVVATALVAAVTVVIGLFVHPREVAASFLVAYLGTVSTVLGVLTIIMIAHLTNATWFRPFRPPAEMIVASLPALAVLGIFLLLALVGVYPWVHTRPSAAAYLNVPFFIVRYVIYWAAWIAIAAALRSACRLEDAGDGAHAARRFRIVSSSGLVVLGLTMTFASFDWMMSLTPEWHSTIYGVYWFAGGMVSALALLAVLALRSELGRQRASVSADDLHALAKLVTTFVLFWLYIGFAQYIVIWSGDLPREVSWYVPRTSGGWGYLVGVLLFGNFVFPFLLLLVRFVKRNAVAMAIIATCLLVMHYLDTFWVVMPGLTAVAWWTIALTIAMVILVVGTSAALAPRPTLRQRNRERL